MLRWHTVMLLQGGAGWSGECWDLWRVIPGQNQNVQRPSVPMPNMPRLSQPNLIYTLLMNLAKHQKSTCTRLFCQSVPQRNITLHLHLPRTPPPLQCHQSSSITRSAPHAGISCTRMSSSSVQHAILQWHSISFQWKKVYIYACICTKPAPNLNQTWTKPAPNLNQTWTKPGADLGQFWRTKAKPDPKLNQTWTKPPCSLTTESRRGVHYLPENTVNPEKPRKS